jgi:hypothetical protein
MNDEVNSNAHAYCTSNLLFILGLILMNDVLPEITMMPIGTPGANSLKKGGNLIFI